MVELGFLNHMLLYVAIGAGIANVCLLSGLFYFYWDSYKQLESKFTIGLLYFSTILLIENVLLTIALIIFLVLGVDINQFEGTEHYSILLFVNLAQFIALVILSKITWD